MTRSDKGARPAGGIPPWSHESLLLLPGSGRPSPECTTVRSDNGTSNTRRSGVIPDQFIDFIGRHDDPPEPASKRRKPSKNGTSQTEGHLEHVVAHIASMDVQCHGSKLSVLSTPKTCKIAHFADDTDKYRLKEEADYIIICDDNLKPAMVVPLPEHPDERAVIRNALAVHNLSRFSAKTEGKLWTDLQVLLFQSDDQDHLRLTFTVKWNTTPTPYHVYQRSEKLPRLTAAINAFFPDPSGSYVSATSWSPQDFYKCAHQPSKDEKTSNLQPQDLTVELYPFQKRTVQWLLRREGAPSVQNAQQAVNMALSFREYKDAQGKACFVSHLFGCVTRDLTRFFEVEHSIKGGILAEEMGLGKTIEIMSLIALHRRSDTTRVDFTTDSYTGETVQETSATLIITPPSILNQWISEIETHTPHFKVFHYQGVKAHRNLDAAALLDILATSNIVVTTYSVLRAEIHFTKLNRERSMRHEARYPRPRSPLMLLSWWRVCLDEAQMVESGVSNAAVVARMIPRVNAWAITGTPVRKDVNDLRGLLTFLRCEPYASINHVWASLLSSHKVEFGKLFGRLALRHTKQSVRAELKLPAQRRYVITMPFTPVEEQYYQGVFAQMCEASALDQTGAPIRDDWNPDDYSDIMRSYLLRLRLTTLGPEIGARNKRVLGRRDGPLRTVDEVLDVMIEQADLALRTEQRALLTSKLKRGQLYENSPRVREALDIWKEAADEASAIVQDCRETLRLETVKSSLRETDSTEQPTINEAADLGSPDTELDPASRTGVLRARLRASLEIEHMATFFCSNAYFQIKSNEDLTKPDSDDWRFMDQLETQGYEKAKKLRQEVLSEAFQKADRVMKLVGSRAVSQSFVQIPEFSTTSLGRGGIESRRVMDQLDALGTALDAQANVMDEWREGTIQILLRPLVDEDEGLEITGDEYENSTKTQDEVMTYVQALRSVIADRHDALTGQKNNLIEYEIKAALRLAKEGGGPFPVKTLELLQTRESVKPREEMGSIRGILASLRSIATSLRLDVEHGNARALAELSIVQSQLKFTQEQWSRQSKANTALEKEMELFTSVMNSRLEYYRQLQVVSDMVNPYQGEKNEDVVATMVGDEEKLKRKITASKSKQRYLLHLKTLASDPREQRTCVICRDPFEVGALTVCGHQFCKECIQHWFRAHHNCPVCKRKLTLEDLHDVRYKPQEISIQAEGSGNQLHAPSNSMSSAIFSEISGGQLAEIKNVELDGPSFTTKVDTMTRHLLWLRDSDPGSKSIIFSQFRGFLDLLAAAFRRFRIGFTAIDSPKGIENFKENPAIECFLLHARAHSSGLNLVNANHVFLCEPLLNTALELQAIARVDRIGQRQETKVWLYLIDGTVEESIYQLSVKRRIEHMHTLSTRGDNSATPTHESLSIEAANSMELQQASLGRLLTKTKTGDGEVVKNEDLWECLFGTVRQGATGQVESAQMHRVREDEEVRRYLRSEATEGRIAES